jgi:phage shock protein C
MLFGVAGGLARYLNIDPSIVRIVWVLLFFAAGSGVLLYIVAAILIPEEPEGYVPGAAAGAGTGGGPGGGGPGTGAPVSRTDFGNGPIIFGIALVIIGGWLLLQRFVRIDTSDLWPILVLGLGLVLVLGSLRGRSRP